ncbi:MAG: thiamine phosphate synthase [Hyphomicrobiales bacterium]|nr:thiamine phosphate synthase [Hyphomicrobiales bacterium]MDE2018558.1 thiamine phosphate synthase [Hyphomicrobiales bacterium]
MSTLPDPFYPIAPDAGWVARLVGAGARFVQLRAKDLDDAAARAEVAAALDACRRAGATLVVNDHWQAAIALRAPWLHLGQGDLDHVDMAAIKAAGIKLGLSTHDLRELERALAHDPDYVALGPIWPTTLKRMPFAPQGVEKIADWRRRVGARALVAIGGVTLERAEACFAQGADGVALVSDVTAAADPEARVRAWIAATARWRR